jgi:hypothetical protein
MSKWFNAPCNAVILALALAACDQLAGGNSASAPAPRRDPSALVTKPITDVEEIASAEPGRDRRQWRPLNDASTRQTGAVTTSLANGRSGPLMLAFANGITVAAERQAELKASVSIGGGKPSFAEAMAINPQAKVYVYRVVEEQLSPIAARTGGLCQANHSNFVAVSEFVDKTGDWTLRVAGFRGQEPPGDAEGDPQLCQAYKYSPA